MLCRHPPRMRGDPVRRGPSGQLLPSLEYWVTRPSAPLRTRRVITCEQAFGQRIAGFALPLRYCRRQVTRQLFAWIVARALALAQFGWRTPARLDAGHV